MRPTDRLADLLFGTDPRMRARSRLTLLSVAVNALSLVMLWHSVDAGAVDAVAATGLTLFAMSGPIGFYALVRSGRSLHLRDPALTAFQMQFAVAALTFAYMICPHVRGMLLMIVALVQIFGAFSLTPIQCRRLGWFSVIALGAAMTWSTTTDPVRFEPFIEIHHLVFASITLPTIGILSGHLSDMRLTQKRQKRELREALELLRQQANRDELTGLPNRHRVFDWVGERSDDTARGQPLAVALIDLDHFKRINDSHGHAIGDEVLRRFAASARTLIDPTDLLARWGGEEFLLLMPGRNAAQAARVLERTRAAMKDPSSWGICPARPTFSCGLVMHRPDDPIDRTIQRADDALYRAKDRGRDRVVALDGSPVIEEADPVI